MVTCHPHSLHTFEVPKNRINLPGYRVLHSKWLDILNLRYNSSYLVYCFWYLLRSHRIFYLSSYDIVQNLHTSWQIYSFLANISISGQSSPSFPLLIHMVLTLSSLKIYSYLGSWSFSFKPNQVHIKLHRHLINIQQNVFWQDIYRMFTISLYLNTQ